MTYSLTTQSYQHPISGIQLFAAFDPISGEQIQLISKYIRDISKELSSSSLESHYFSLKKFYEYLEIATLEIQVLSEFENEPYLLTLIRNYPFYLSEITGNRSDFNSNIRSKTGHSVVSANSLTKEISHINKFLAHSAFLGEMFSTPESDSATRLTAPDFHKLLVRNSKATVSQMAKMRTESLIGSVIKQSKTISFEKFLVVPKYLKPNKQSSISAVKIYPFDKFQELLNSAPIRERLLYLLLGAGGLRTHEATQIRLEDLHHEHGVLIRPYSQRKQLDGHSEVQLTKFYKQKGRNTESIFWIPGYETAFNRELCTYLKWRADQLRLGGVTKDHGFLFVKSRGPVGEPLYDSYRSSQDRAFDALNKKIGVEGKSKHSLRHMYGTFMLNQMPTKSGRGLSLEQVMKIMGHSNMASTQIYAQINEDDLKVLFADTNKQLIETAHKNLIQLKSTRSDDIDF